jgi:hypothetical protein
MSELMNFSAALAYIKNGKRLTRQGWNGEFVFLVPGSVFEVNRPPLLGIFPSGTMVSYQSHIDMKTAQGAVMPWLATQTDLLAEDWMFAE